jgi:hypothetical protein
MGKIKQKLLLIQPHSDDILFSSSYFILHPDEYECEVLTIENNPKRIKEDKALYEFLGIKHYNLNVAFDDQSYYGYHKQYKEVTAEDSIVYLQEYFGKKVLSEIEAQLKQFIDNYNKTHKAYIVVAPWGIGHPFHLYIRMIVEQNIGDVLYYREFPHSYKKRSKIQVIKQQEICRLLHSFDLKECNDVKWQLAKKFYKSQSSLLWFEQGYIKKQLPEEIYMKIL